MEAGSIRILPVATETAAAPFRLGDYAGAKLPRLMGLTWGAEDLSSAIGASTQPRRHQRARVRRKNISFYQQDAREIGSLLTPEFLADLPRPWTVIEDADHHYLTTRAVIEFFSIHLKSGEYLVIEDGICNSFGNEERYDGGPNRAISEVLAQEHSPFEIATEWCDYFGYNVTWCTNGYLRRV